MQEIEQFCLNLGTSLEEAEDRLRDKVGDCLYFQTKDGKGQNLEALYFAAFSIVKPNAEDILEIGTGLGDLTIVLCRLFEKANIYTFDLPEYDNDYKPLAIRKEDEARFKENMLDGRIQYRELNSFHIMNCGLPFMDLIWVDGGHRYPAIAWDAMLAYNLSNRDCFLCIHDYNRANTDVKGVVDYMQGIIPETINYLPFAGYDQGAKFCWLKKQ